MNRNEQDILQKLREKTENIQVPEQLCPKSVEQMLEGQRKKRAFVPYRAGALAAACLVLVVGAAVYGTVKRDSGDAGDFLQDAGQEEEISKDKTIASAKDYEEVYSYIERYKEEMDQSASSYAKLDGAEMIAEDTQLGQETDAAYAGTGDMGSAVSTESAGDMESATSSQEAGADYSETNVRQEGVDEGDVVKTDGTYLYVLKDNRSEIAIVDTRNQKLQEISCISLEDSRRVQEMYLSGERLALVYGKEDSEDEAYYGGNYWYGGNTAAVTYDISDPENPKELGEVTQSGQYQSSRVVGGYLYLFSNYGVAWDYAEKEAPETYIPLINDEALAQEDIFLPPVTKGCEYTVVTAVKLDEPSKISDSKAILSEGGKLYVSNQNIYYYETVWGSVKTQTTLRRLSYEDGKLAAGAQGTVDGYIKDSFSIDEYGGYLRVVTTEDETNSVYVLDMELEVTGSIKGLAEDERVYSARFMGDTGYFVTFRETDPLFSADLSDPEKPRIIGQLKIPGFSDYLHPYGEGKLLGIGMNVDADTMVTDGVKLTMFDISDPADVKEEDTYILENVYSTDVSYDYKAALADAQKNIIGFAGYTQGCQKYFVFEYDENNGFDCMLEEEINGSASLDARGVYIEETLYVVQGNIIEAYSLEDGAKIDDIIL